VVLSDRLWKRRFGGDPSVLGQVLTLDGRDYKVIGVMPDGFEFPLFWAAKAELWAPIALANRRASDGESLRVFGRLKGETGMPEAQAELDTIGKGLDDRRGQRRSTVPVQVVSLHDKIVGNVQPTLLVLAGTVGFVLLIACVNV